MTVLNNEQAMALIAALPKPDRCDGCDSPFTEQSPCHMAKIGPFPVWLCPTCMTAL